MNIPDDRSRRAATLLVIALVLVGVGLRAWLLLSPIRHVDADEAVVGLMAGDLLDGRLEAFFWGQHYGGIHEAVFVGALLFLRLPRLLAVKLVPVALFAGAALLVWRIGRRIGGDTAGQLAGALFWAAPAGMVWMSTKERGFYGSTLVLSLAVVVFALRVNERWSTRDTAALGLVAGSAWYASPQAVYVLIPVGLWLAVRAARARGRRAWRLTPWAGAGLAIGALPWLAANVHRGWASLEAPPSIPDTTFFDRLELFFRQGLPAALGLRHPVALEWVGQGAGRVAYAVALPLLGVLVFVVWRRRPAFAPLGLALASYPLLFAAFPTSFNAVDPRYLTFLAPLLAVLAASAITSLRPAARVGVVAVMAALAVAGTGMIVSRSDVRGNWDVAAGNLTPLVDALEDREIDRVFADYWIAYRLDLETDEKVIAAPLDVVRHEPYERAVREQRVPVYVFFLGTPQEYALGDHLSLEGIPFERFDAGIYVVYVPDRRVLPEEVSDIWARARGLDAAA